jgi:G3E family GTPase
MLVRRSTYRLPNATDIITFVFRGSAFPATLAFQLRELERETEGGVKLDAIITVIDAENFAGYEDTSVTAKMQASYTDLILIVRVLFFQSSNI